jgi:glucose dehydrogenase
VFDGMVFAATVPVSLGGIYQGGDRGVIHALDGATGQERWQFDTIQSPDLWGNPSVNSGGGAWYPPSFDPTRGLVYWGIANPAPFPGTPEFPNGSSRPGPNLYTDSTVALDVHTGQLRWYHQVVPHDLFDRDLVHTMVVRPTTGSHREVVVATGKAGVVVGLDPATGRALWSTKVGSHHNDDLTKLDGPTKVLPGTFGGVLTPPATADGTAYVAVINAPSTLQPDKPSYIGSDLGLADGDVVAVDAATGKVRWSTKVPGDPLGGATVVNDLVFTALLGGQLVALDRSTGRIVRTIVLPGGVNGWMAVAGDELIVPVSNATPAQVVALRLSH